MPIILIVLFLFSAGFVLAAPAALPKTEVFNAMQDELLRTKTLHMPGQPKPFFVVGQATQTYNQKYHASWGALTERPTSPEPRWRSMLYMLVGDEKKHSGGFQTQWAYYEPSTAVTANSYKALRTQLWQQSDKQYSAALESYAQKEAYIRKKQLPPQETVFLNTPSATYQAKQESFPTPDKAYYEDLVKTLSALGKKYPYLEKAEVSLTLFRNEDTYLNTQGAWYQTGSPWMAELEVFTQMRNKDGVQSRPAQTQLYPLAQLPAKEDLIKQTDAFFAAVNGGYNATKAEPYLGPVLLTPGAAAAFWESLFVYNVRHSKPVLENAGREDTSAGAFKDKVGLRVTAPFFHITDRPQLKEYKGQPMIGFMPVDSEGVQAQDLTLVEQGKLTALPSTRSPIKGQKASNGHARMSPFVLPRATLTNTFFTPATGVPVDELEQKLRSRCQEQGLSYCYILDYGAYPSAKESFSFKKIYTADGRTEPVYGVKLQNFTPRSLRDISAAGSDETIISFFDDHDLGRTIVTPSLLVEEIELVPDDTRPDRPPFTKRPD